MKTATDGSIPVGDEQEAGTYTNPIRYKHIKADDPQRKEKLKAQREQFGKDAEEGKVLCLTDLFISHGL